MGVKNTGAWRQPLGSSPYQLGDPPEPQMGGGGNNNQPCSCYRAAAGIKEPGLGNAQTALVMVRILSWRSSQCSGVGGPGPRPLPPGRRVCGGRRADLGGGRPLSRSPRFSFTTRGALVIAVSVPTPSSSLTFGSQHRAVGVVAGVGYEGRAGWAFTRHLVHLHKPFQARPTHTTAETQKDKPVSGTGAWRNDRTRPAQGVRSPPHLDRLQAAMPVLWTP